MNTSTKTAEECKLPRHPPLAAAAANLSRFAIPFSTSSTYWSIPRSISLTLPFETLYTTPFARASSSSDEEERSESESSKVVEASLDEAPSITRRQNQLVASESNKSEGEDAMSGSRLNGAVSERAVDGGAHRS